MVKKSRHIDARGLPGGIPFLEVKTEAEILVTCDEPVHFLSFFKKILVLSWFQQDVCCSAQCSICTKKRCFLCAPMSFFWMRPAFMELIMGFKQRETSGCRRLLRSAPGSSDSKAPLGAFVGAFLHPGKLSSNPKSWWFVDDFHPFQSSMSGIKGCSWCGCLGLG